MNKAPNARYIKVKMSRGDEHKFLCIGWCLMYKKKNIYLSNLKLYLASYIKNN